MTSLRLLAALLLWCATAASRQLPFSTPGLGVAADEITALHQDRGGFLWIGSLRQGLLRFDGRRASRTAGLPDARIDQVVEDARGYLWVATSRGLAVSAAPLDHSLPGPEIRLRTRVGSRQLPRRPLGGHALAADTAGNVWCGVTTAVRFSMASADSVAADSVDLRGKTAAAVFCRRNGETWFALNDGSFMVRAADRSVRAVAPPAGDTVCAATQVFHETSEGTLFGGRPDGLLWKERLGETEIVGRFEPVLSLMSAPGGALWVGTGRGIFVCDTTWAPQSPLPGTEGARRLLLDREENVWVGGDRGLAMLAANFRAFTHLHAGRGIREVLGAHGDGAFWAGADTLELCIGDSCSAVEEPELRGARILCADEEKRLWLSSPSGLFCLAPEGPELPAGPLAARSVRLGARSAALGKYLARPVLTADILAIPRDSLEEQTLESVWFAGDSVLCCLADGQWYMIDTAGGLPRLSHAVLDAGNRVSVGAPGAGLLRSEIPVSLRTLQALAGGTISAPLFRLLPMPIDTPVAMLWNDGRYWIGLREGVTLLDAEAEGVFRRIPLPAASDGRLTGMAERAHTVWLGTTRGLVRIDADSLAAADVVAGGLLEPEIRSLAFGSGGELYCAHPSGLTVYRPWLDTRNHVPPALHFTTVTLLERGIDAEWTGVSLREGDAVRYRFRLEGYEGEWAGAGARTHTRYTNLPAWLWTQTYTLEVLSSNADGVWNARPLRFAFTVAPPWYLSWWFVLLAAAAAVLAGVAAQRAGSGALRKRNLALRRLLEEQRRDGGSGSPTA